MVVREQVSDARSVPSEKHSLPEIATTKVQVIDPRGYLSDSQARLIMSKWGDFQQHGRIIYDQMIRHPAVSAPFETVMSFIKSSSASFTPTATDPTPKQAEMAEFLNSQIKRLGMTGQARDGWIKLLDGLIRNGLIYGFGLAEIGISIENWRGRPMKQVAQIRVLPQASLDDGLVPREEMGDILGVDPRYRCFDFDDSGRILRVYQFRQQYGLKSPTDLTPNYTDKFERRWDGPDLLRILHYVHNGGDNNPFGESLFYQAFYPYSDLYVLERQEQGFLDVNSVPYLTANYDSDKPSPNLHEEVKTVVLEQDPKFKVLVARRTTFGSVSASNPAYTEHIKQIKDELRAYITQSILVPAAVYKEDVQREQTVRDVIQMFIKFRLPAILREIEEFFTWQFGRRLIDSNYSGVEIDDYPRLRFRVNLDNDLRVAVPLLQQGLRYVDAERIGEALEALIPNFKRDWIPKDHKDSVDAKRPLRDVNDLLPGQDSKESPPDQTGTKNTGGAGDGSSKSVGQEVETV